MTDQSQYLAQALQQMSAGQAPAASPVPQLSLAQMQKMQQDKAAWETLNPGQSYTAHAVGQMGQNLLGAPGRVADSLAGLGQVSGPALGGLQALAQRFGGGQTAPY